MSLPRERRRLGRAFKAALLAVGSPTIVIACTSSIPSLPFGSSPEDGGSFDATQRDATGTETGLPASPDASTAPGDAAEGADTAAPLRDGGLLEAGVGTTSGGCFLRGYELDAGPDADAAGDICGYDYGSCGLQGNQLTSAGCAVLQLLGDGAAIPITGMSCWLAQGSGCDDDAYAPGEGGAITIYCSCPMAGGRRPAGLRPPRGARRGTALASYLAQMAFEEDASILAFGRMEKELASLGAPASLVADAARAACDEARHVRVMARLARGRDARGRTSRRTMAGIERAGLKRAAGARSAAAVAAENMAEGCVRETYGALVARWQSLHAHDSELRRAFAPIAADEARHAALSWTVARWITSQLDPAGRRRVGRARSRALRNLRAAARVEPLGELVRQAGLPTAREAGALLEALCGELALS